MGQLVGKITTMRTTGKKQAVRNALYRLGLRTIPKGIVEPLAQQRVQVNEELVRGMLVEILKETNRRRVVNVSRPALRRCPNGFPGRRGNR